MRNLALEKNSRIRLLVIENKRFFIRHYEITFSMNSFIEGDVDVNKLQIDQNVAFAKALTFIDAILNDSVLITVDMLPFYEKTFCEFENNFVLVPDTTDPTLISAIQRKLTAIIGDCAEVVSLVLYDMDDQLRYRLETYEQNEKDDDLPSIKEFLGEFHLTDVPWWDRADETTWDGVAANQEEYDVIKNKVTATSDDEEPTLSMFEEIEENIRAVYKNAENTGQIIEVDFTEQAKKKTKKWKPEII